MGGIGLRWFPWQRGSRSASRQAHPTGSDNAPADQRLGVWLRVLTPVAGANWGGHFTPRPGQEVLVSFEHGNIDRPVISLSHSLEFNIEVSHGS